MLYVVMDTRRENPISGTVVSLWPEAIRYVASTFGAFSSDQEGCSCDVIQKHHSLFGA
jgi:hypothetical protein